MTIAHGGEKQTDLDFVVATKSDPLRRVPICRGVAVVTDEGQGNSMFGDQQRTSTH